MKRNLFNELTEGINYMNERVKFSYKIDDVVFFTAYPKKNPNSFFVCKGTVQTTTAKNGKAVYRVKIESVREKPLLGDKANPQHLLGKIVTKRESELSKKLSPLMDAKEWIE